MENETKSTVLVDIPTPVLFATGNTVTTRDP